MSKWRFGCGKKFSTWVPRGYDYKEIKVECGSTSPSGDPYQCDDCYDKHEHVNFREDAREWGEEY